MARRRSHQRPQGGVGDRSDSAPNGHSDASQWHLGRPSRAHRRQALDRGLQPHPAACDIDPDATIYKLWRGHGPIGSPGRQRVLAGRTDRHLGLGEPVSQALLAAKVRCLAITTRVADSELRHGLGPHVPPAQAAVSGGATRTPLRRRSPGHLRPVHTHSSSKAPPR